jgi:hypothetical protein
LDFIVEDPLHTEGKALVQKLNSLAKE